MKSYTRNVTLCEIWSIFEMYVSHAFYFRASLTAFDQVWMNRLKEDDIIPQAKRADFVGQVFWNVLDIIAVNTRLRDALTKRQKSYAVVDRIGDILLEFVPHFGPFVEYGAHQLYGKYEFEREKNSNPTFANFVEVLIPFSFSFLFAYLSYFIVFSH